MHRLKDDNNTTQVSTVDVTNHDNAYQSYLTFECSHFLGGRGLRGGGRVGGAPTNAKRDKAEMWLSLIHI